MRRFWLWLVYLIVMSFAIVSTIGLYMMDLALDKLLYWAVAGWALTCCALTLCFVVNEIWLRHSLEMNDSWYKLTNSLLDKRKESAKELVQ